MTKNDLQHPIWRATCLDRYSRDMQAKCPRYLGAGGWSVTQACMHLQTKINFSFSCLVCSPETKFSQFILAQILIKTRTCCLFPLPFAAIHHSVLSAAAASMCCVTRWNVRGLKSLLNGSMEHTSSMKPFGELSAFTQQKAELIPDVRMLFSESLRWSGNERALGQCTDSCWRADCSSMFS